MEKESMNCNILMPIADQSIAKSVILQFYKRSSEVTRLPVAFKIFLQAGLGYKGHLLHGPFHQVRHIEETDPVTQESKHRYLIGCIQYTGEIAALMQGLRGQDKISESFNIGLLERQHIRFPEVITGKIIRKPPGEAQCILDGQFHIG